jgi:hypothetical protein
MMISVTDAAQYTGYSEFAIREFCRKGNFTAEKPRGNRGGWSILKPSLEQWWMAKRRASTNRRAK